jgi:hypothetical protein
LLAAKATGGASVHRGQDFSWKEEIISIHCIEFTLSGQGSREYLNMHCGRKRPRTITARFPEADLD